MGISQPVSTEFLSPDTDVDNGPLSSGPVVLSVSGLSKSYNKVSVLKEINLQVREGEAVALIGSNGAGKSTALRSCLRLIDVDHGQIRLLDQDINQLSHRKLRRLRSNIGFVFQKHNLVPRLSALTNVIHGHLGQQSGPRQWLQFLSSQEIRERAYAMLERVKLQHIAMQRSDRLSGGQSQRVAIARALMQNPKMIVADEPVASLDPVAGEKVMDMFIKLCREEGITVLFTTHNIEHALNYSDRVIAIKNGVIGLDALSSDLVFEDLNRQYHDG